MPGSLSALVARILNQLSLSAWLPGAFLVASVVALAWFNAHGRVTFDGFGLFVQRNWIPILVLALPTLVISVLITQAFAFEAIRGLEGYSSLGAPLSIVRDLLIRHQLARKRRIERHTRRATIRAFAAAKPRLVDRGVHGLVLLYVEMGLVPAARPAGLTDDQKKEANQLNWLRECSPWDSARITRLRRMSKEVPRDSHVMPTRLGNVLRSTEDSIRNRGGESIASFALANMSSAPSSVREQHNQFRTRLDMYCTLVFVTLIVAAISVGLLWDVPLLQRVALGALFTGFATVSYSAAVSSARGYCAALRQMDKASGAESIQPVGVISRRQTE